MLAGTGTKMRHSQLNPQKASRALYLAPVPSEPQSTTRSAKGPTSCIPKDSEGDLYSVSGPPSLNPQVVLPAQGPKGRCPCLHIKRPWTGPIFCSSPSHQSGSSPGHPGNHPVNIQQSSQVPPWWEPYQSMHLITGLVSEDPAVDSEADPCLRTTLLTEQGTGGSSIHSGTSQHLCPPKPLITSPQPQIPLRSCNQLQLSPPNISEVIPSIQKIDKRTLPHETNL